MIGERLAELRKLNGDTQESMAKKLHTSTNAVRGWEQNRTSSSQEMLIAICKLYGTSADYLLGLTDIDPSDEARKQRQRLTEEEQNEMHRYEEYLLCERETIASKLGVEAVDVANIDDATIASHENLLLGTSRL